MLRIKWEIELYLGKFLKDGTNSTWKQQNAGYRKKKDGTMREKLVNVELLRIETHMLTVWYLKRRSIQ